MRKFAVLSSSLFLILFPAKVLMAQQAPVPDTLWQSLQVSDAAQRYEQEFSGPNSPVYQGYEYVPYILPVNGNPFFDTNEWQQGSVDFDGKIYKNLALLYDIRKDQLVLQSPDKLYRILVPPKKVSMFTIRSHHFIRIIRRDSLKNIVPVTGYYEQLVTGRVSLLAKRMKTVVITSWDKTSGTFVEQDNYYIKKGNRYYRVKTRRSVLKVLADEKKAVKRYLRKKKLYFNENREAAIVKAVKYYNTIK